MTDLTNKLLNHNSSSFDLNYTQLIVDSCQIQLNLNPNDNIM